MALSPPWFDSIQTFDFIENDVLAVAVNDPSTPAPTGLEAGSGHQYYTVTVPKLILVHPAAALPADGWSLSPGKRWMDITLSTVALVLLAPLFLLIALMVAISSEGPVLFSQRRAGRGGELFTIYKFRTMHAATHHRGPVITQCGDARVTTVGRLLRKFKLDELPQFYNVLRGDMSLVGPRPKVPHHQGTHMPYRPGITGAATLAFRCEEQMLRHIPGADLEFYYARAIKPLKSQMDREYMRNATLWSDLAILGRTAAACTLPPRYHPMLSLDSPDLGGLDLESLDVSLDVAISK